MMIQTPAPHVRPSQEELSKAFDLVKSTKGWKYPVNKVVKGCSLAQASLIEEAIVHFTGSIPSIAVTSTGYRFRAAGYYSAIGA